VFVHVEEAIEDLPRVVFDVPHGQRLSSLLRLAQSVFKRPVTELHHRILYDSFFPVRSVEKVEELDHIWCPFKQAEDLILAADDVANLLGAFEGNFLFGVLAVGFEHVT